MISNQSGKLEGCYIHIINLILTLSIIHYILALTDCLPSAYDSYRQFSLNVLAWFHISPCVRELHFQTFELRVEQGQNHISQALLQHAYLMDLFYHHTMGEIWN